MMERHIGATLGSLEAVTTTRGIRFPVTIGDYYLGSGLQLLIQQLVEKDPNRYVTLPALKAAMQAMLVIKTMDEHFNFDVGQCIVC
ncbi:hypothetical protein SUGI_0010210 [Cryptomeria japonica]|nr:hypothetical protein SUGI_0010210 [Cryptomeria japonica]